jgi:hypothetical protein
MERKKKKGKKKTSDNHLNPKQNYLHQWGGEFPSSKGQDTYIKLYLHLD